MNPMEEVLLATNEVLAVMSTRVHTYEQLNHPDTAPDPDTPVLPGCPLREQMRIEQFEQRKRKKREEEEREKRQMGEKIKNTILA